MARDMTQKQFDEACQRHGFEPRGFMGYYRITKRVSVSIRNAGPKRRDQLAYLLRMREEEEERDRLAQITREQPDRLLSED
jgi:hypothetical protein